MNDSVKQNPLAMGVYHIRLKTIYRNVQTLFQLKLHPQTLAAQAGFGICPIFWPSFLLLRKACETNEG